MTYPVAYYYEMANAIWPDTGEYFGWHRYLSFNQPEVKAKGVRNIKPLFDIQVIVGNNKSNDLSGIEWVKQYDEWKAAQSPKN